MLLAAGRHVLSLMHLTLLDVYLSGKYQLDIRLMKQDVNARLAPLILLILLQDVIESQIYPPVSNGFTDENAYIRELTVKAVLTLAPKMKQATLNQNLLKHLSRLQVRGCVWVICWNVQNQVLSEFYLWRCQLVFAPCIWMHNGGTILWLLLSIFCSSTICHGLPLFRTNRVQCMIIWGAQAPCIWYPTRVLTL